MKVSVFGPEIENLRLYGIPSSSKAASIGATEREPFSEGLDTIKTGLGDRVISVAECSMKPRTEENSGCSISRRTCLRHKCSTNH